MPQLVCLALTDRANKESFYKLEAWQLETFIRMAQESPVDGFQWLYENCNDQWVARITFSEATSKHTHQRNVCRYDMNEPGTLSELIVEYDMIFPDETGDES